MRKIVFLTSLSFLAQTAQAVEFEKTKMDLGKVNMTVEVADNDERREQGLMNRTSLRDDEGMIFVFSRAEPQSFWMKNTLIPLSIGFFNAQGKLFQIIDMQPASPMDLSPPIYNSSKVAKYALEEPLGWYKRKKVSVGAKLSLPKLRLP